MAFVEVVESCDERYDTCTQIRQIAVEDLETGTRSYASMQHGSSQTLGNYDSASPAISYDGRYVAFSSLASQLVGGDTNEKEDVFVRDRSLITTKRVSISSAGAQGNGVSRDPSISKNGQQIAFESDATNLAGSDANGFTDVFHRDVSAATTSNVDTAPDSHTGPSVDPSISGNGGHVAFTAKIGRYNDAHPKVYEADTDPTGGVSCCITLSYNYDQYQSANGASGSAAMGADGFSSAFVSEASNLVAPPSADTNATGDVFVHVWRPDRSHCEAVDREALRNSERFAKAARALLAAYLAYLTAQGLDQLTAEKQAASDTIRSMRGCGWELFHYTDQTAANGIYSDKFMVASPPKDGYPAGAYATTITPLDADWTRSTLSIHLFEFSKDVSAYIMFCSNRNRRFRPTAWEPTYWFIPGAPNTEVPVTPAGPPGSNPMPK